MKNINQYLAALAMFVLIINNESFCQTIQGNELPPACTNCQSTTVNAGKIASTLGISTQATDTASFSAGFGSNAAGKFSMAFGYYSQALLNSSFAAGHRAKAEGDYSAAIGYKAEALYEGTYVLGKYVKASQSNSIVIGKGDELNQLFLNNNISNSIMMGVGSTYPTLTIRAAAPNSFGKVGIGTTNPSAELDVFGTIKTINLTITTGNLTTPNLTIPTGAGNGYVLKSDASGNASWASPTSIGLWLKNGTSYYYSSGNVGIGISAPTQKLEVNGTIKSTGFQLATGYGAGKLLQSDGTGIAQWTSPAWTINGDNIYQTNDNGNVGIGITSPTQKLDVNGTIKATGLQLTNGCCGVGKLLQLDVNGFAQWTNPVWTKNGTNIYTTNGDEKVGIGITNPSEKMEVDGFVRTSLGYKLNGNTVINSNRDYNGNNGTFGGTLNVDGMGNSYFSGNVGIGTNSPTAQLQVGAGSKSVGSGELNTSEYLGYALGYVGINTKYNGADFLLNSDGTNNGGALLYSTIGGNLYFITVPSTGNGNQTLSSQVIAEKRRMTITNDGKIGIGTTSPAHVLDVQNPLEVSANFYSQSTAETTIWTGNTVRTIGFGVDPTGVGHIYSDMNKNNLISFTPDKKVLIGDDRTTPGTHKLYVNGSILTTEVKIAAGGNWPDYVFDDSYELMKLTELESFIKNFRHLPGVLTQKEVIEEGMNLAENDAVLLKKIEELTLYIIQQEKKLNQLEDQVNELKNKQ